MTNHDETKHPRATDGTWTDKHRDEPEGGLLAVDVVVSTQSTGAGWTIEWHSPDGKLHRTDGPAMTHRDGTEEWWEHGKRQRTDGPAIIRPDGPSPVGQTEDASAASR